MFVTIKAQQSKVANGVRIINPGEKSVRLILEPAQTVKVEDDTQRKSFDRDEASD
jgi:hypothetical protein